MHYKLLAKILANRLKIALPHYQSFSGGLCGSRQILDRVLIANEVIDSRKRARKEGVISKIDVEKAYIMLTRTLLTSCYSNLALGRSGVAGFKNAFLLPPFSYG